MLLYLQTLLAILKKKHYYWNDLMQCNNDQEISSVMFPVITNLEENTKFMIILFFIGAIPLCCSTN